MSLLTKLSVILYKIKNHRPMITRPKQFTIYSLLLLGMLPGLLLANPSNPQEEDPYKGNTIFQSLKRTNALEITIETDLTELLENRFRDEYQKAAVNYTNAEGEDIQYDLKLRPRGKFRRRVCDFPPVKLKFPKKQLLSEGYSEHNDLKLVTHCLEDKFEGNENVMKEYLAYLLFNELSPNSFQVQVVKITYIDTSKKYGKIKRLGFLIEDTDEMAERLNGDECDCIGANINSIVDKDENLMSIFQYMIGNEDWNTKMARNLKMVKRNDGSIIPVPYDFDFSGLVDASYALPNADYNLVSVKDRIFMGQEVDSGTLGSNIFLIKNKKKELYKVVEKFKYLSLDGKAEILTYLDTFYKNINDLNLLSTGDPSSSSPDDYNKNLK